MDKDSVGYSIHHHHGTGVGVFTSPGSASMLERGEIVKMSSAGMPPSHGIGGTGAPLQGDMTLRHMPHVPYSINGLLGPNDGPGQGTAALHHGKLLIFSSMISVQYLL